MHVIDGQEQRLRVDEQLERTSHGDSEDAAIERVLDLLEEARNLERPPPRWREGG